MGKIIGDPKGFLISRNRHLLKLKKKLQKELEVTLN